MEDEDDVCESEGEEVTPSMPLAFSLGDTGKAAVAKKAAKAKGKKKTDKDTEEEVDGEETVISEADLLRELEGDLELKMIHKALDRPYGCLLALKPEAAMTGNRVGHQIRGVSCLELCCFLM